MISEEPSDINSPEHEIWDDIQSQEFFKIINPEQSDVVAQVIEDSKAKTFFNLPG